MTAIQPLVMEVARDEVLSQLERILRDGRFASADRNSRFLRYVVEGTLEGKASEIKEVVIATEIYGRAGDYDPKIDSVVRVEASRLRAKLRSYYEQQGAQDPVLITIPKGSYVPKFEHVAVPETIPDTAPETPAPDTTAARPRVGSLRTLAASRAWAAFGAALIMALWLTTGSARVHDNSAPGPNPETLAAWQEGVELLRQDPNSAVTERGMPPTLARALERYEFAVSRDPSFAKGWASLAEAYDYAAPYVGRNHDDDIRRAEAAARKAIALDPNLAAGHAMLGLVCFGMQFKFAAAEKAYRRTIELDPRSTYASIEYSDLLRITGRFDEAEAQISRARALQPGLPVLAVKQAEIQLDRKQTDAAIATLREALRLRHDVRRAHVALGVAWEVKGDFERALSCYREALAMYPQDRRALPALGYLLGKMNRREEALAVARQLEQMNDRVRNLSFQIAVVYSGLGEYEKAIEWLECAQQTRQSALPFMAIEYRFRPIQQHPRFQEILQDLGLKLAPESL